MSTDKDSYHLLICFADSLDPDKAIHYVGSDLDPKIERLMVFLKVLFEKDDFGKRKHFRQYS